MGETKFRIPLPRHNIKDGWEVWFDEFILTPELYSKQAQVLDYDSKLENAFEYRFPYQLDFRFGDDFYKSASADSNKWTQAKTEKTWKATISSINNFFDSAKPVGTIHSPVIVDWIWAAWEGSQSGLEWFHSLISENFYVDKYDPDVHGNFLPAGAHKPDVNAYMPPTTQEEDARHLDDPYDQVRFRIHVAPNSKIGFSNDALVKILGFAEYQYEPKSKPSDQIVFSNPYPDRYRIFTANNRPLPMVPATTNKITLSLNSSLIPGVPGILLTKRGHLKRYDMLATDYGQSFQRLAEKTNIRLRLEFNSTTKTFKFVYPDNPDLKIDISLPPDVSAQLGFGREVDRITSATKGQTLEFAGDLKDLREKSCAIVYDVGLAFVSLENSSNIQTIQFQDKVLATLFPYTDGTMRMLCSKSEPPKAEVSYFGVPELVFTLNRFSESMEPVHIALPCGTYVSGQLMGEPIKEEESNQKPSSTRFATRT